MMKVTAVEICDKPKFYYVCSGSIAGCFCQQHMVPNSSLENAFRTHLASAVGYYHHLLCRLQSEFDLSLAMCVDFYYVPESKTRKYRQHILLLA